MREAADLTWACSNSTTPVPLTPVCDGDNSTWLGITCNGGCVTEIILDGSVLYASNRRLFVEDHVQLTGTVPSTISKINLLKVLSLPKNYLKGSIPYTVGFLSNLQILNLAYNGLNGGIPASIGLLTHLQVLSLTSNSIAGPIPSDLGALKSLKELNLAGNSLSGSLPSSLCSSLTTLTLQSTNTGGNAGVCYPSCVDLLTNKTYGNLTRCSPTPTTGNSPLSLPERNQQLNMHNLTRFPSLYRQPLACLW